MLAYLQEDSSGVEVLWRQSERSLLWGRLQYRESEGANRLIGSLSLLLSSGLLFQIDLFAIQLPFTFLSDKYHLVSGSDK